ncbi:hypothetical protein [Geoalkalibacter sp.]|uniref:hypothetical protein n=1 Tax=Geoalkalibacter sp. TaxID=3041440 RepID=UPI00272E9B91|nr:hypothetical protein [Geoalkalibacter sp.]
MTAAPRPREIACQQVLLDDSSVFSVQWLDLPRHLAENLTPVFLLERYLAHLRRFTLGLVRPRRDGERIRFCLLETSLALLEFSPPRYDDNNETRGLTLEICGGFLVQPALCDRGRLELATEDLGEAIRVRLQLSDFCPLLLGSSRPSLARRWFYRLTQAAIHKVVTVRFLLRLYRELAGPTACVKVVPVRVREGRPT